MPQTNAAYLEFGGIHPPVDDIPGRLIGEKIGLDAFNFALPYFSKIPENRIFDEAEIFPNPTDCGITIQYEYQGDLPVQIFQTDGKLLLKTELSFENNQAYLDLRNLQAGVIIVLVRDDEGEIIFQNKIVFD